MSPEARLSLFLFALLAVVIGLISLVMYLNKRSAQQRRVVSPPLQPSAPAPQPALQRAAPVDDIEPDAVGGERPSAKEMAKMPLSQLIRVLGLENVMKVDDEIGMTPGRIFLLLAWVGISAVLLIPSVARLLSHITTSQAAWWIGGVIPWLLLMGLTLPFFLVYVREDTALIGVGYIGGRQHIFQTRLNIKYPTETVHKRNFIDLELAKISETVTYNSKDGARYTYTYLALYRPSVKRLPIYRAVKEEDIISEVQAIVRSALSLELLKYDADKLGDAKVAANIEKAIRQRLGQMSDEGHELEYRFGINIINLSLSEPTPSEEMVEGRQAKIVAKLLREAMETLRGEDKDLSAQEAANLAAMLNKEKVTKVVNSYEYGNLPAAVERMVGSAVDRLVTAWRS